MLILLLILIMLAFGGGGFLNDGAYRGPGFGIGGVLIVVLVALVVTERVKCLGSWLASS